MAELYTKSGVTGVAFGIPEDEGSLVTNKVSINRKIKKKDLRGKQGGYKCIASYDPTVEISIEGALVGPTPGTTGFTLGLGHSMANDPFSLSMTLFVENISITEKNEDFKKATVKLNGYDNLGTV